MAAPIQICRRCIMDATVPKIRFDSEGYCNYCTDMIARGRGVLFKTPEEHKGRLDELIQRIKQQGAGKRYDCVVGISGGVDSSWALYQAIELGLRPLAVHMDNGWNSELAQRNIEQLVTRLGVDLHTHVIDWHEYRKLMQAFFDADVIDVELLYDNAMLAVNLQQAAAYGVQTILTGHNQATEGMRMPEGWNWFKRDRRNIHAIWRRFGDGSTLQTFPAVGTLGSFYYSYMRNIRWVSFLDYFAYDKFQALAELKARFDYRPYPYKHYESVFTRFYQGYILPRKFGVDKRRLHLGTLVVTGQLSREAAIADLAKSPYPSEEYLEQDIQYFLKKMRWSRGQLAEYLARPGRPHASYGTEKRVYGAVIGISERLLGARD